jgi:hypothetical protein
MTENEDYKYKIKQLLAKWRYYYLIITV